MCVPWLFPYCYIIHYILCISALVIMDYNQIHFKSLVFLGPFHKPRNSAETLLRSDSAAWNLRLVLWWQLQRYIKKVPQHGRPSLWMPLTHHSSSFRENGEEIIDFYRRRIFLITKRPETLNGANLDPFVSKVLIQSLKSLELWDAERPWGVLASVRAQTAKFGISKRIQSDLRDM